MDNITSFTKEYEFLSTVYPSPITVDGITYLCAESAFYAQRVKDVNARKKIKNLNGNKARAKALQAEPVEDWEENKLNIMLKIQTIKFQDPELKKKLLATGNAKLINNNTYRDDYWGIYMGKGKNNLGKILMGLRMALKEK